MFRRIVLYIAFSTISFANPKEYMVINKSDWILGAIKLDVNFTNGAFNSFFGIFLDESTIVTSSAIGVESYPNDINIKIKDKSADLIICIAKARLIVSDDESSLALLKIKHYTDDYCNFSNKKFYHYDLIHNQEIRIPHSRKSRLRDKISVDSPFLLQNSTHTIALEQGFPYFDIDGNFVGLSSNNKIIKLHEINAFINKYKSFH